jgi:hypothetical protein
MDDAGKTHTHSAPPPRVQSDKYSHHVSDGRAARRGVLALVAVTCLMAAAGAPAGTTDSAAPAARDGQHDFDFARGVWHTHIRRALDPFSGTGESVELNGTVTSRPVWGGKAWLEEIEADGPKGHWQGASLFLYNPAAHQWSQTFVNSKSGMFTGGMIGEFTNGVGELFASDTFKGRAILVRARWSEIRPDSHRYEEFYSADGGATWALSFSAEKTRQEPR